jgi:hypothetical protein
MPSARRQRLYSIRTRGKNQFSSWLKFIIPILVIGVILVVIKLDTKYWNGNDKFNYVYRDLSGNVDITVLDPKLSESTTLIIPGDTQVDVAGNYGTIRVKNVWQLGINEKLGGNLIAATVTKNFLTPVFLWSDNDVSAVQSFNFPGIIKFIIAPKKTNITLGDRIAFILFTLQVKSVNNSVIDLGKSQFLKKTNLSDGQPGYILSGPVSSRLTVNFSDNDFADQNLRVDIVDATGKPGSANTVGQIIQILGGKVVSVDRKPDVSVTDCVVLGNNAKIVNKIAALFSCKTSGEKSIFDLEIRLGSLFAKRY